MRPNYKNTVLGLQGALTSQPSESRRRLTTVNAAPPTAAAATALCSAPGAYRRTFMALAHSGLGLWLLASYRKLEPSSIVSVKKYYKRIWDLFYIEYLIYPFI